MSFYRNSTQRRLRKFFKKHNFDITEGGKHVKAKHVPSGKTFIFPRSNSISKGLTKNICDQLIQLGYDKKEVKKAILK